MKSTISPSRVSSWKKPRPSDPENLEVRYDEVNLLAAEGQTDKAIEALKALLKDTERKSYSETEKGTRVKLLERLGELYRVSNQNQPAIDTFRQIADLDPDSGARAEAQIVDTYRAAKDFKNARAEADARPEEVSGRSRTEAGLRIRAGGHGQGGSGGRGIAGLLKGEHDRETQLAIAQLYERAKRYEDMAKPLDAAEKLSETKPDKETVYLHARRHVRAPEEVRRGRSGIPQSPRDGSGQRRRAELPRLYVGRSRREAG